MKQQSPQRSVLRQILSVLIPKAPGQVKQQVQAPQRPAPWYAYWETHGQPWRMEPEIDTKRQQELERCRVTPPNIGQGIYPFSGMKLSRADIEWLLATHENGRGPVNWSDESQRKRKGLNLCGADLRGVDLQVLPLARLCGYPGDFATEGQYNIAAVHLEEANLSSTHLEGANLYYAHLERANLEEAHLEGADLSGAHLQEARLSGAHLEKADLSETHLEEAFLSEIHMQAVPAKGEEIDFSNKIVIGAAHLEDANLYGAYLDGAMLRQAHFEGANLRRASLTKANVSLAHLEEADLTSAHLEGANLTSAYLMKATLKEAHLEGTDFFKAHLEGAVLCGAFFDSATALNDIILGEKQSGFAFLVDARWDAVNLAVVNWSVITELGDERIAHQRKTTDGVVKSKETRLDEYRAAVRANRQLAVVLQGQGLNEDGARFAYRAQVLQKTAYRLQMLQQGISLKERIQASGSWLFFWFLLLLAGYGYKPLRSFLAYLFVIVGFATSYYLLGLHNVVGPHHVFGPYHLTWYEAIVVSMTAFHGRGFFANQFQPGDPQAFVAAFEAFVGLIIEVTFIATLTRRLFGQ